MANDDDDDDYVKFEISDKDIEFGYGIQRTKRMSKNQAIYGIWAESESDDDNDNDNDKNRKKHTDYTSGVNFVKSEQKLYDEQKSTTTKNESKQSKKKQNTSSSRFSGTTLNNAGSEFGQWEMYTKGVGSKLLQKMGYQPGKGLGKNLQGIIEPIEAKKRPGTGSIGLYGPESTARKLRKGDDDQKNDKEKNDGIDDRVKNEKNWKRKNDKTKTIKIYEKSLDDIIGESVKKSFDQTTDEYLNSMKIIDMTGPQQQILSGLTKLHQLKPEKPKDNYDVTEYNTRFDIPELRKNIERLIMLTEKNLLKRKRDYDHDINQIENLKDEHDRLNRLKIEYQQQLKSIETIETFLESLDEIKTELTFENGLIMFENFFKSINNDDELMKRQLRSLKFDRLIQYIFGMIIRRELRIWHPFDANESIDYSLNFKRLQSLVLKSKTYDIILWKYWYPIISRSLQSISLKIEFESIITFIDKWRPLLPKWLYEYFLANNLMKKLLTEVDEWNPLIDIVSIHSWIHPWLSALSIDENDLNYLFEPIYEIIRSKLSNALKNWHPNDCSARLILEPWKNVFNESSMQTFLEINIVPKLEQTMQQMQINPNQQSLNEWTWTLQWSTLLSTNTIVSILERTFFPKWLNVLYVWLNSGVANFQEISSWYQGWKTLIGDELINHPIVKEFLRKALIMMDHAVNLETGLKSFHSYYDPKIGIISSNNQQQQQQQQSSIIKPPPIPPSPPQPIEEKINFRQMIEMKAAENNIVFMPIANRYENGHQIFKFGQYLIYIDNQVIFQNRYQNGKRLWMPVSLSDLLIS